MERHTQIISVAGGDAPVRLIGVLELSATQVTLAVLSPQGLLWARLTQDADGTDVHTAQDLPPQVRPQQVLEDVRLVNWPDALLAEALAPAARVERTGNERALYLRGKLMSTVAFDPAPSQWRTAELTNHQHGYTMTVEAK